MPNVKCDWNMCRFNSNNDPDLDEAGECQFDGTVELKDISKEKEINRMECASFGWREDGEQVEGKSV